MTDSRQSVPRRHPLLALAGSGLVLVAVFALVHALADKIVSERYPAPEQAAVWSMIGVIVSATVAVAAAAQAWSLIRRR